MLSEAEDDDDMRLPASDEDILIDCHVESLDVATDVNKYDVIVVSLMV